MLVCEEPSHAGLVHGTIAGGENKPFSGIFLYLAHVHHGQSLRSLARATGLNPSTILRRVRKIEDQRDDPLIDDLLNSLPSKQHNLPKQIMEGFNMVTDLKKKQKSNVLSKQEQSVLRLSLIHI